MDNKINFVKNVTLDKKTSALMEAFSNVKENTRKHNILFEKQGSKSKLGVLKHGNKFLIVKINEGDIEYIGGQTHLKKYLKETLDLATNTINLMLKEEDTQYILSTPALNQQAPKPEYDTNELDGLELGDEDNGEDNSDNETEDETLDTGEAIETDLEEYQELSGKLAYIVKESSDKPDTIKYVLNTIIASLPNNPELKEIYQDAIERLNKKGENNDNEAIAELAKKHGYIIERIIDADDRRIMSNDDPEEYFYFRNYQNDINDNGDGDDYDLDQEVELQDNLNKNKKNPFL